MSKIDFKKSLDSYKARLGEIRILDVPQLHYLMIDGHGDPNTSSEWSGAITTLYPVAYGLKFISKNELGRDYVVMPLEGLWWADDMNTFTTLRDKSQWNWTAMIMVPDWTTPEMLEQAKSRAAAKNSDLSLNALRMETLSEGLCVQTLHLGSYDDEGPILQRMHDEFIPENGLRMTGKHHEIYLSDSRRVAPEKLRTILRQPVERI